ncbi:MAG: transposase [Saprospiraceae bacterium]
MKNWNCGWDGAYFITICTKDRHHFLGEIMDSKMQISPAGAIAHVLWHEIKNHGTNIELGEFIVMPNHIHGVLILNGNNVDNGRDVACNVPTRNVPTESEMGPESEPTTKPHNKLIGKNEYMATISPKSNSISTIIQSYKSAVTRYCNRLNLLCAWQPRFHDHIIRNEEAFLRISEYLKNNPANWQEDTFY